MGRFSFMPFSFPIFSPVQGDKEMASLGYSLYYINLIPIFVKFERDNWETTLFPFFLRD